MAEEKPPKKARTEGEGKFISIKFDFCSCGTVDPSLSWLNPPHSATFEGAAGLKVIPKPATDLWCKTYREPPLDRASMHALVYDVPAQVKRCVAQTEFSLTDHDRYDQAGIVVYVDAKHWLKAGIEIENGKPNMSCVATNQESDWNYISWPNKSAHVRVTMKRHTGICDCEVEYLTESGEWCFFRDTYIVLPDEETEVKVGILVAAPKKENDNDGMEAFFKSLSIEGE